MTLDEINGLASAIKIATEKGFWEQASFIAVIISAAISAVALWFIRAQMKGGNDQLEVLTEQVGAMRAANVTSTEQLKIFNQQLEVLRATNGAIHQQMVAAHDRAAKELAINLMLTWEQRLQFESRQVARLVHRFTDDQCGWLENLQEFHIDKDQGELAELCIPENLRPLPVTEKGVLITGKVLMHLRFSTVSYLNLIESILTA